MAATLTQLRTQVRDLADEPASGGFANDDRLTDYINHALGELHDILITSYEDMFIKQQTVTLVAGTESYSLATDFHKAYAVFAYTGGKRYKLKRFTIEELDRLQDDVIVIRASGQHLRYRIIDNKIWFTPTPGSAGTVQLWYIYQFTPLSAGGDTISANIIPTWEDFVVCSAAHRLLVRGESENAAEVLTLKEQARQRIIDAAQTRDTGDPDKISDINNRFGYGEYWGVS